MGTSWCLHADDALLYKAIVCIETCFFNFCVYFYSTYLLLISFFNCWKLFLWNYVSVLAYICYVHISMLLANLIKNKTKAIRSSNDLQDLQMNVDVFTKWIDEHDLRLNVKKCKSLLLSRRQEPLSSYTIRVNDPEMLKKWYRISRHTLR